MEEVCVQYAPQIGTNKWVSIFDVQRGLACNCYCPVCMERLVARQGEERVWSFAHHNKSNCRGLINSYLHYIGEQAVTELDYIMLPKPESYSIFSKSHKFEKVQIKNVVLEKKLDNVIPDIIITDINDRTILFEIRVTHKVQGLKRLKLFKMNTLAYELNISNLSGGINKDYIKTILTSDGGNWNVDCINATNVRLEDKDKIHKTRLIKGDNMNIFCPKVNTEMPTLSCKRCKYRYSMETKFREEQSVKKCIDILADNKQKEDYYSIFNLWSLLEHTYTWKNRFMCKWVKPKEKKHKEDEYISWRTLIDKTPEQDRHKIIESLQEGICPICGNTIRVKQCTNGRTFITCDSFLRITSNCGWRCMEKDLLEYINKAN